MKPPHYYRQRAAESSAMARSLAVLFLAAVFSGALMTWTGSDRLAVLACAVVAIVSLLGRWIERNEARHNAWRADIEEKYQAKETKRSPY